MIAVVAASSATRHAASPSQLPQTGRCSRASTAAASRTGGRQQATTGVSARGCAGATADSSRPRLSATADDSSTVTKTGPYPPSSSRPDRPGTSSITASATATGGTSTAALASTYAPGLRPLKRSARSVPSSGRICGRPYASPTKNPPNTIQKDGPGRAGSNAPSPSSTSNASRTATGAPASAASVGLDRTSTSTFRLVSTSHCRDGPITGPAPRRARRPASARPAGSTPPGPPSRSTSRSASKFASKSASRSAAASSSSSSPTSGPVDARPAECGPAVSGSRRAGPGGGGTVGEAVKPGTVRENWGKRRDHAAAGSPRPASRS